MIDYKIDKEGGLASSINYAAQSSSEQCRSRLSSATFKLIYLLKPKPKIDDETNRIAVNGKWMCHQNVVHLNWPRTVIWYKAYTSINFIWLAIAKRGYSHSKAGLWIMGYVSFNCTCLLCPSAIVLKRPRCDDFFAPRRTSQQGHV